MNHTDQTPWLFIRLCYCFFGSTCLRLSCGVSALRLRHIICQSNSMTSTVIFLVFSAEGCVCCVLWIDCSVKLTYPLISFNQQFSSFRATLFYIENLFMWLLLKLCHNVCGGSSHRKWWACFKQNCLWIWNIRVDVHLKVVSGFYLSAIHVFKHRSCGLLEEMSWCVWVSHSLLNTAPVALSSTLNRWKTQMMEDKWSFFPNWASFALWRAPYIQCQDKWNMKSSYWHAQTRCVYQYELSSLFLNEWTQL